MASKSQTLHPTQSLQYLQGTWLNNWWILTKMVHQSHMYWYMTISPTRSLLPPLELFPRPAIKHVCSTITFSAQYFVDICWDYFHSGNYHSLLLASHLHLHLHLLFSFPQQNDQLLTYKDWDPTWHLLGHSGTQNNLLSNCSINLSRTSSTNWNPQSPSLSLSTGIQKGSPCLEKHITDLFFFRFHMGDSTSLTITVLQLSSWNTYTVWLVKSYKKSPVTGFGGCMPPFKT